MPAHDFTAPIHHCLKQRADNLNQSGTWAWVIRDPVVGCFAPALPHLEADDLISLDDALRETCQKIYWHTAAHWVRREAHLKRLLSRLRAQGIEVIPLKGAALLETLYPELGLREMADIDLLVREADFITTAEILLAQGLKPKWEADSGDLFAFHQLPQQFWPGELSFYDGKGLHIDVHRDLVTSHWFKIAFPVDVDRVWARSRQPEPGDASVWERRLDPCDMLSHLCLHAGLNGMQVVKNLFDIDQFIRKPPADWNWDAFLDRVAAWQLGAVAYHLFAFCQHLFNTPLPASVMTALTPGLINRWSVKRLITPPTILADRPTVGKRYPTLVKFALIEGAGTKAKTVIQLFFPKQTWLRYNPAYQHLFAHWMHLFRVVRRGD